MKTVASGLIAGICSLALSAGAAPKRGFDTPDDASLEDVEEKALSLKSLRGRATLVVYEDKESSKDNAALKAELAKLLEDEPALKGVRVIAAADVSDYDFFPAKGAVKDAIRDEQKKAKTTIWLDWSGDFRDKLKLDEGRSNIVLVDAKGKVRFGKSGALSRDERRELFAAMRDALK
jgi:hypothetical protein